KSRNRRRKLSSLAKAKNAVRGSVDPTAALTRTLGKVPPPNQHSLLQWAEHVRFGRRVPVGTAFPASPPETLGSHSTEAGAQEKDIGTATEAIKLLIGRLKLHSVQMRLYVEERQAHARALIASDYSKCEAQLSAIQARFGYSIWLL